MASCRWFESYADHFCTIRKYRKGEFDGVGAYFWSTWVAKSHLCEGMISSFMNRYSGIYQKEKRHIKME